MKKRVVVVSTFSGMDLFLLGCIKAGLFPGYAVEKNIYAALMHAANFKYPDGTPVMTDFVNIDKEEYIFRKTHRDENNCNDLEDTTIKINDQYVRTKEIQEISGSEIRTAIERHYGKDVVIILIGGPPCQDLIKLNKQKRIGDTNRNLLCLEFLRILEELNPDVAIMEQSSEFLSPAHADVYQKFKDRARQLNFKWAHQQMNSIHYQSNQQRVREIFLFVNKSLGKSPVFPEPILDKVKRVKDFLDIDYFHSGNFCDKIKTPNNFMCTVTSGAPLWFYKGKNKWHPTVNERLLCMDVYPGDYFIPESVPTQQVNKGVGNGVVVALAQALAATVLTDILNLKPDGEGFFVPINSNSDGTHNDDSKQY